MDAVRLPFLTPRARCRRDLRRDRHELGVATELSTTGGTSDGRFIARICPQVIEFGPPNASIHKIDEHIELRYIDPLKNIYRRTLETCWRPRRNLIQRARATASTERPRWP
jgi:succinyl-diaminopimelate desuccinylase